jgi:hypothetical protein
MDRSFFNPKTLAAPCGLFSLCCWMKSAFHG